MSCARGSVGRAMVETPILLQRPKAAPPWSPGVLESEPGANHELQVGRVVFGVLPNGDRYPRRVLPLVHPKSTPARQTPARQTPARLGDHQGGRRQRCLSLEEKSDRDFFLDTRYLHPGGGRSPVKIRSRSRGRSHGQSGGQSQGRSCGQSRGRSRGWSRGRSRGRSRSPRRKDPRSSGASLAALPEQPAPWNLRDQHPRDQNMRKHDSHRRHRDRERMLKFLRTKRAASRPGVQESGSLG